MHRVAFINNKFVNFNKAFVHIEDRGLQFSDSVYEVIPVFKSKIIDIDYHINRLKFSLSELYINYKINKNILYKIFKKLVKKNSISNGIIYLQITRGVQEREHVYNKKIKPNLIIYSRQKKFNLPANQLKGVKAITHEDLRWKRRDIKTVNLLPNIIAANKAKKMKCVKQWKKKAEVKKRQHKFNSRNCPIRWERYEEMYEKLHR